MWYKKKIINHNVKYLFAQVQSPTKIPKKKLLILFDDFRFQGKQPYCISFRFSFIVTFFSIFKKNVIKVVQGSIFNKAMIFTPRITSS